jgi:phage-related protein
MATFPDYCPVFSAAKASKPKTKIVTLGDGYEQRIRFGLNQNPKEWSLTFDENTTDADVIEGFLDARAEDSAAFDWTPPHEAQSYKWVCESWVRQLYVPNRAKISATFRQVFEV